MSPYDLVDLAEEDGVLIALSPSGGIYAQGYQSAIDRWLPAIRQSKASIIFKLQLESRRAHVLAELQENPNICYAIDVIDPDADPVIIAIGIRGVATFEINVPQVRYDPFALLELLEKHPLWSAPQ
jgi:hypothetical protein